MKLSNEGARFIKDAEGLRLKAYRDSVGIPTIGYGHTKGVRMGDVITEAQADAFFVEDVAESEADVARMVKVPLSQNQFDALVSFVFNLGGSKFQRSTLLRQLNEGQYDLAARQFDRWVYGNGVVLPGLVKRRAGERKRFEAA